MSTTGYKVNTGIAIRSEVGEVANVVQSSDVLVSTQRILPTIGIPQSVVYADQVSAMRQKAALISGTRLGEWISPTPYFTFACKVDSKTFDYVYKGSSTSTRKWGKTPVALQVGPGTGVLTHGSQLVGGIYKPIVSSNLIHRTESEAMSKLNDGKINLAVALAEGKRTVSMITRSVLSLLRLWRFVRQGNIGAIGRMLGQGLKRRKFRNASDIWLQIKYGWYPLIQDIFGGVQQVKQILLGLPYLFRVERTGSEPIGPYPPPSSKASWEESDHNSYASCRVVLYGRLTDAWINSLNQIGFLNPALIAWELMPFSFVIDWLLPIGTWLQALAAPLGIAFKSGTRTTTALSRKTYKFVQENDAIGRFPSVNVQNFCMDRIRYGAFPTPLPYLKSPFSGQHIISAIALIVQQSSSRRA